MGVGLIMKLEELNYHGCLTGDCPHEKQCECDNSLKEHFLDVINQGCGIWNRDKQIMEYDHLHLSSYESALRFCIEKGWINESQLLRSL